MAHKLDGKFLSQYHGHSMGNLPALREICLTVFRSYVLFGVQILNFSNNRQAVRMEIPPLLYEPACQKGLLLSVMFVDVDYWWVRMSFRVHLISLLGPVKARKSEGGKVSQRLTYMQFIFLRVTRRLLCKIIQQNPISY